jgi:hypothetical protein
MELENDDIADEAGEATLEDAVTGRSSRSNKTSPESGELVTVVLASDGYNQPWSAKMTKEDFRSLLATFKAKDVHCV